MNGCGFILNNSSSRQAPVLHASRRPQRPDAARPARLVRRGIRVQRTVQHVAPRRIPIICQRAETRQILAAVAKQPLKVMIAGPPAAGKGTQCSRIVEKYGLIHISVGDILRAEIEKGTAAGKKAKSYMDKGDLVPNEVVVGMVRDRLQADDAVNSGWLLDGYPRSRSQADAIEKENIRPEVFILINVPDDVLIDRVSGRRLDPETGEIYHMTFKPPPEDIKDRLVQRSDDTAEKMTNRLKTYHSNLDAIMDIYKDMVVEIDGNQSIDDVFSSITNALEGVQVP